MKVLDEDVRNRLVEASRFGTLGRLLGSLLHEMSTPLGAISLRAESLAREADDPSPVALDKRRRYAKGILDETQRCKDLMGALRDLMSPGEPGSRVDLAGLCREAMLLLRHDAMKRQVTLVQEGEVSAAVEGQRERLGQAILSLLVNALDASSRGGRVRVVVAREGREATVLVEDDGEGVPGQVRLFEPFSSSRSARSGFGLGLMAARAVAEGHGGAVVHERGADGGSRFVLRLPAGR